MATRAVNVAAHTRLVVTPVIVRIVFAPDDCTVTIPVELFMI